MAAQRLKADTPHEVRRVGSGASADLALRFQIQKADFSGEF